MGALPQALEIIFEVKRKRHNEKLLEAKKALQFTKHIIFLFSSLWTPPTFEASNFFISCSG
jgi:hypothetical protein